MRKTHFTCDAESVQGNPGAEVTFRRVTVGELARFVSTKQTDAEFLAQQITAWKGIVDDDGNELPAPTEAGTLDQLYIGEQTELVQLLIAGASGEHIID